MRPTNLQFRNPTEFTPFNFKESILDKESKKPKATMTKENRFQKKNVLNGHELSEYVGPGTYYPEQSFQNLSSSKCSTVFSRKPAYMFSFKNPSEFTVIGNCVKHVPQMKQQLNGGSESNQFQTIKSLKKLVQEANDKNDQITVKDIYFDSISKKKTIDAHAQPQYDYH